MKKLSKMVEGIESVRKHKPLSDLLFNQLQSLNDYPTLFVKSMNKKNNKYWWEKRNEIIACRLAEYLSAELGINPQDLKKRNGEKQSS